MKISTVFPEDIPGEPHANHMKAVVIDVLRATSSILTAFAAGAEQVIPVLTTEEAFAAFSRLPPGKGLLAGERGSRRIDGFHLGNSPLEFTPRTVKGKTIVMTTTNGTRAFRLASRFPAVLVGSFLNASAVASHIAGPQGDIVLICSGRKGRFSLEDWLCAGLIASKVAEAVPEAEPCDFTRAAGELYRRYGDALPLILKSTEHGKHLVRLGFEADIDYCSRVDALHILPLYVPPDGAISLKPPLR